MRSATTILVAMAVGLTIAVGARWVFVRLTANRFSPRDVLSLSPPKTATLQWQPPRQDEPWTPPPTGLPESIIAVATVLFELGFADPRGCEYREVELPGEAEANRNLAAPRPATHAWVMPQGAVDGPRYAVAWNGLVYPVLRVGAAADLDADIRALSIAPDAPTSIRRSRVGLDIRSSWSLNVAPPFDNRLTASQHVLTPATVVILLRLGRTDAAEALWQAGTGEEALAKNGGPAAGRTWYGVMACAWAWALYDRAQRAHERGDDQLAMASLRDLTRVKPRIEDKVRDPRFVRPDQVQDRAWVPPDLRFLDQVPALLADQERRARKPLRAPALDTKFAHRAERIAALIGDFDQISGARDVLVGRHNLSDDLVVRAVVREGDEAVAPLLECLERDDRLTRNVYRDERRPNRNSYIQGVDEAAYAALCSILGTRQFGSASFLYRGIVARPTRVAAAAEIRAYWERTRGLGTVEGLFRTLADDAAPRDQWLEAAEVLARPSNVHGRDDAYPLRNRIGKEPAPLTGEPLRGRVDPSVTELITRRIREFDPPDGPCRSSIDVHKANRLAKLLAAWDPRGAPPTLKNRVARCAALLRAEAPREPALHRLVVEIPVFTELRVRGGDATALDDYAEWIRAFRPANGGFFATEMFETVWTHPDHPAIAAAATALFEKPESPWLPLFRPGEPVWRDNGFRSDLVASPLLGVTPFRKQVLAGLADDRPSGTLQADAIGRVTIVFDKHWTMTLNVRADDPNRPRPGSAMTIRMRDKYAWKLQQVEGFPRFELYWPRELRDQTIAELAAMLNSKRFFVAGQRSAHAQKAYPAGQNSSGR